MMKRLLPHLVSSLALGLLFVRIAHGDGSDSLNATIPNPLGSTTNLVDFIKKVVDTVIMPLGAIIAVIMFILTGFTYVMAQGNEAKVKSARSMLINTVIGTAVLLGAWVITDVVTKTISELQK